MKLEYHPAVEAELREIQGYYEDRTPGLGTQFIDEFERQVLALAATPERWMTVNGGRSPMSNAAVPLHHLFSTG
jgi:toxin ParE1/3/4